ncbi:hypothetical protein HMPREF9565_01292 [Cutibacterium acnes HL053PA2]|uniref:hypothetical protein n=1 Tax=Cutibacterium acnes TaxID=1747 RepID=UPI0001EF2334|nr:hypothetical protein [Cutibacterium acnes]OFO87063.1 hypothetical protein HMPREF3013_07330 [Propionibacterium sp. HMSC062D05]EFS41001.1 hypothetical protein HMPREF9575_01028 [Cutibacterium acnes HL110PA1]EFS43837.1 hypothetical protein HMPREF9576_01069 [Cutibacterium acnes HL110PA2]EFS77967.1 hypothetical protein HMPREF9591_00303 [Cutibacterium acnes HL086PA1]EFT08451.1 hypothetical protein HMPREF9618_00304 [Cutibacterium acnes HL082PA1]
MGGLRFNAIAIDEVRDIFGADEGLAMKLRRWAEARFSVPVHHHRRPRWRSPFHPLYKPNVECSMLPTGWPTPHDVEDLVCGRYIESDRSARCWRLVNEWLTHLSWGWTEVPMSVARFEELDRDLAAAGLPSTYSLKRLMDEDPQIPLRPAPGMKIGYAGTRQILATWVELSEVIGTVPIARRGEVNAVLKFLSSYPGWNHLAVDLGRPAPGLLVVWQPDTVEDAHPTGLRAGRTAS